MPGNRLTDHHSVVAVSPANSLLPCGSIGSRDIRFYSLRRDDTTIDSTGQFGQMQHGRMNETKGVHAA